VVLLDIDDFKLRNDVYGHASGDEVLRILGYLVSSTLRVTDIAARYGGEELVVVLPGANVEGSRIFAERLRDAMREATWPDGPVTASFGTSEMEDSTPTGRRLIAQADHAMYAAKRAGKDRVVDFGTIEAITTVLPDGPTARGAVTS
jgi:diguanylate cyclase (GGDEF)-like protein